MLKYCHDLGVTGFGLGNEFIDHLYTPLGTTSTYSVTANVHNSRITTASTKPFPACCGITNCSLATASNSGDSSASHAQVLSSQPPSQNSALNWQLPGWWPFHTNLQVFSSQADFNWLGHPFAWTQWKTPFPTVTLLLCAYLLPQECVYRSIA
jgi:hypothetical protein